MRLGAFAITGISVRNIVKKLHIIPVEGGFDLHALACNKVSSCTRKGMRIEIYPTLMSTSVSVSTSEFAFR